MFLNPEALSIMSSTILLTTLIFIAWYAAETYKIRKNSIRPTLVCFIRSEGMDERLRIRNIGFGPASDIEIGRVYINDNHYCDFDIDENFLVPNQEVNVSFYLKDSDGRVDSAGINFDHCPLFLFDAFSLGIFYSDIEGKKLESRLVFIYKDIARHKILLSYAGKLRRWQRSWERLKDK